jgi:hypothetical protein
MPSAALLTWTSTRADRIERLRAVHQAFGGSGRGRRWVTDELNHALILRLAGEFQGFSRELHDEAGLFVARSIAPGNQQLQNSLRIPYTANRKLNQGNADPGTLGADFGLFGLQLWSALYARYPTRGPEWNKKLKALNTARNGIVHDDAAQIAKVQAEGWSLTLQSVTRWKSALDGLTQGMDRIVHGHLRLMYGVPPW